MFLSPKTIE